MRRKPVSVLTRTPTLRQCAGMENSLGTVQELGARTKAFLREHALGAVPRDVCTLAFPGLDAKHLRKLLHRMGFSDFRNGDGYFTANEIADRLATGQFSHLSLSEIKSGRIDGANLRGAGWARCGQRPEQHATLVHPCSAIGA